MPSTYTKPQSIDEFVTKWNAFSNRQESHHHLHNLCVYLFSPERNTSSSLPPGILAEEVEAQLTEDEHMCLSFLQSHALPLDRGYNVSQFVGDTVEYSEYFATTFANASSRSIELLLLARHFGIPIYNPTLPKDSASVERAYLRDSFKEVFRRCDKVLGNLKSPSRLEEIFEASCTKQEANFKSRVTDLLRARPDTELFFDENEVPCIELVLFTPKTLSFEGYNWTNAHTLRLRMFPSQRRSHLINLAVHSKRNASVQSIQDRVGRVHPHVDRADGSICFGEAANMGHILRSQEHRLVELVDLCVSTLSNYNDESPFWHLPRHGQQTCSYCDLTGQEGGGRLRTVQDWMRHNHEILPSEWFEDLSPDELHHCYLDPLNLVNTAVTTMTWAEARNELMCSDCYTYHYSTLRRPTGFEGPDRVRFVVNRHSPHVAPSLPFICSDQNIEGDTFNCVLFRDLANWYDAFSNSILFETLPGDGCPIYGAWKVRPQTRWGPPAILQSFQSLQEYMQTPSLKEYFRHDQHQHLEEAIRKLQRLVEEGQTQTSSEVSQVVQAT